MKFIGIKIFICLFFTINIFSQVKINELSDLHHKIRENLNSFEYKKYEIGLNQLEQLDKKVVATKDTLLILEHYFLAYDNFINIIDFGNANIYLSKSAKILSKFNNNRELGRYYNCLNITVIDREKAYLYQNKARDLLIKYGTLDDKNDLYINLYRIYKYNGEWAKSLEYSYQSLKILKQNPNEEYLMYQKINIVMCNLKLKNFEEANKWMIEFEKHKALLKQKKYLKLNVYYNYCKIAILEYRNNNWIKKETLQIGSNINTMDSLRDVRNLQSLNNIYRITISKNKLFQSEQKSKNTQLLYQKILIFMTIIIIVILLIFMIYQQRASKYKTKMNQLLVSNNEELKSAIDSKNKFLNDITHELKTPLNTIKSVGYLLESDKNEFDNNLLKLMNFSSNHLLNLINDIIDFNLNKTKNNTNKVYEIHSFELEKIISNIFLSIQIENPNNNQFHLEYDQKIPKKLIFDEKKISQVIYNLLNNSNKFTKNGIINLIIQQTHLTENKSRLYFEVNDNGIGISKEAHQLVFEPLKQENEEISLHYGGTGIGLSIVKQIVEELGGSLKLISEKGLGTSISFELEFEKDKETVKEINTPIDSLNNFSTKKILLVEDNKINQMITKKIIERTGYKCDTADNGYEATILVEKNDYALIFMDLLMPLMDGFEATKIINKQKPTIPIVILSAISDNISNEKLEEIKFTNFLTKPLNINEFYQTIENIKN